MFHLPCTTLLSRINTKIQSAKVLTWSYLIIGPGGHSSGVAFSVSFKFESGHGSGFHGQKSEFTCKYFVTFCYEFPIVFYCLPGDSKIIHCNKSCRLKQATAWKKKKHSEIYTTKNLAIFVMWRHEVPIFRPEVLKAVPCLQLETWEVRIVTGASGRPYTKVRPSQNLCRLTFHIDFT